MSMKGSIQLISPIKLDFTSMKDKTLLTKYIIPHYILPLIGSGHVLLKLWIGRRKLKRGKWTDIVVSVYELWPLRGCGTNVLTLQSKWCTVRTSGRFKYKWVISLSRTLVGSCTWEGDRREGHCSKWSGWERETWQSLLSWKKIIAWYCKSSAGSQHQVVCFFFGGIFNFWDPPFLTQPLECWQAFHGSRNYLDPNLYWSRVFRRGALGLIQWIRFTQVPGKRFLRDMLHFVDTH